MKRKGEQHHVCVYGGAHVYKYDILHICQWYFELSRRILLYIEILVILFTFRKFICKPASYCSGEEAGQIMIYSHHQHTLLRIMNANILMAIFLEHYFSGLYSSNKVTGEGPTACFIILYLQQKNHIKYCFQMLIVKTVYHCLIFPSLLQRLTWQELYFTLLYSGPLVIVSLFCK